MSKLAVLILAAGSSSRMGFPKQLLKWKDTNLLQHAIDLTKVIETDGVFLVLGAHYKKIITKIDTNNITVLRNDTWKEGLGNSIAFGVQEISKLQPEIKKVLIMLADQPLIDINYLSLLINTHFQNKNEITCTQYKERNMGVPAVFNRFYFDELCRLNQDKGAKKVLERYSEKVGFIDGRKVISDIDSKEDYEVLFKKHH